ncbi:uncharacterized protein LOC129723058 isoform X1 [Wyeomyia smithii]|uniref:uncharacterized protein LOC129723058 isoform X1 n=1 Tax=Wyeomyia smithii TaxID=174621 RepID=UPI002467BD89|nr:uncharacterized protein LOC129723058 isoform X1 [Wyeomyia smithii]XP_055532981.1 uncharacterized protein LOC129723058 isoform X1 [Wyeomyia smithii]XP_055532982.1 uncharacterized protein LOC129723058 isoform X1 [Wyeomyia smithii]XP_055532983.1 uncharacterized protein LOC129723058 isoform X1 [Wyeomyia smithii]
MVKTIQKHQKHLENNSVVEELDDEPEPAIETEEDFTGQSADTSQTGQNVFSAINLEKEIDVNQIFSKTPVGREIQEFLSAGNKPNDEWMKKITHVVCDCMAAVYGVRPETFYKEMLARSLVKTYPILASTASVVPHALWFYENGRGVGAHGGKIQYRMEYLAKKSQRRLFHRNHHAQASATVPLIDTQDNDESNIEELINELQLQIPTDQTKPRIFYLWKRTLHYRNNLRKNATLLQFIKDFPVTAAFEGQLITLDFESLHPNAPPFQEMWECIHPKILDQFQDVHRFLKNDLVRALCIIRTKNPTRGVKRPHDSENEKQVRKLNPLHGIVEWINQGMELPQPDVPIIVVLAASFDVGDCNLVWRDIVVPVGSDLLNAFVLLLQTFVVCNVNVAHLISFSIRSSTHTASKSVL